MHFLAMEGLSEANDSTVDQMAVETFLRGCKDKEAAHLAMENNPNIIYKALKYVKAAVNNRKALFGSRANYHTRSVSFQDEFVGPTTDEASIRTLQESKRDSSEKLEGLITKLIGLMEQRDRPKSRSPTPPSSPQRRRCYLCKGYGH